MVVLDVYMFAN